MPGCLCRLKIRSEGKDSVKTAISHMNLGDLYLDWGDLDKAQKHAERALALRRAHRCN